MLTTQSWGAPELGTHKIVIRPKPIKEVNLTSPSRTCFYNCLIVLKFFTGAHFTKKIPLIIKISLTYRKPMLISGLGGQPLGLLGRIGNGAEITHLGAATLATCSLRTVSFFLVEMTFHKENDKYLRTYWIYTWQWQPRLCWNCTCWRNIWYLKYL